jgi:hypothetical protein
MLLKYGLDCIESKFETESKKLGVQYTLNAPLFWTWN